jgi:hypothetical protein
MQGILRRLIFGTHCKKREALFCAICQKLKGNYLPLRYLMKEKCLIVLRPKKNIINLANSAKAQNDNKINFFSKGDVHHGKKNL